MPAIEDFVEGTRLRFKAGEPCGEVTVGWDFYVGFIRGGMGPLWADDKFGFATALQITRGLGGSHATVTSTNYRGSSSCRSKIRKMSVRESESPFKKRSHAWIDARSMEMAEAIADKIRRDPVLLATAVEDLARWKEQQDPWPACLTEWEEILGNSTLEEVLEVLVEDSEEGRRRR